MRSRLPSIIVAALVAASTFFVSRHFGYTLLFVPLFLFFSWGGQNDQEHPDDELAARLRLNDEQLVPVCETEDEAA